MEFTYLDKETKQKIDEEVNKIKTPPKVDIKNTSNLQKKYNIKEKIEKYGGSTNPLRDEKILVKNKDHREKVQNPTKFPYSPIGYIEMKFGNKKYQGSGVMIFPMIVLTAAHNVYNRETCELVKDIKFIPGKKNDVASFGVYNVLDYFFLMNLN